MAKAKGSAGKHANRRGRRKPRGALAAICALLVTSGLLRVAIGAGEALAREEGDAPKPPQPIYPNRLSAPILQGQRALSPKPISNRC